MISTLKGVQSGRAVFTRRQMMLQTARGSLAGGAVFAGIVGLGQRNPLFASLALTESTGEGPYYKPDAPFRSLLIESGVQGVPFLLSGRVLDPEGALLRNAVVDLWQADATGVYDNQGFRLRGRVRTDQDGRYSFQTIRPKFYGGRPAHFHLKVYGDGLRNLTTQLFFQGDPLLERTREARSSLILTPKNREDGLAASFDFVMQRS